jgi:hypothetical protein
MAASDWDKEMAKIDKQLESISDDALIPSRTGAPPAEKTRVVEERRATSTFGVFARLVLAVVLGIAMLFWPYQKCGAGIYAYLFASAMVAVAGGWTAIWTWRHRSGQAHILSLLLIVWGIVLGTVELLPRVGYAKHVEPWACPVAPTPAPPASGPATPTPVR